MEESGLAKSQFWVLGHLFVDNLLLLSVQVRKSSKSFERLDGHFIQERKREKGDSCFSSISY